MQQERNGSSANDVTRVNGTLEKNAVDERSGLMMMIQENNLENDQQTSPCPRQHSAHDGQVEHSSITEKSGLQQADETPKTSITALPCVSVTATPLSSELTPHVGISVAQVSPATSFCVAESPRPILLLTTAAGLDKSNPLESSVKGVDKNSLITPKPVVGPDNARVNSITDTLSCRTSLQCETPLTCSSSEVSNRIKVDNI